jgi:hypothetical protein
VVSSGSSVAPDRRASGEKTRETTPILLRGWLITVAYLVTVWLCLRAGGVAPSRALKRAWHGLALAFALLGLNKQLDLQTLPTEVLRLLAHRQGWYEQRRPFQLAFLVVVGIVGLLACWQLLKLARGPLRPMRVALGGAVLLICFIVMRAASFHHLDRWLQQDLNGLRLSPLLEFTGIVCVAVAAFRRGSPRRV